MTKSSLQPAKVIATTQRNANCVHFCSIFSSNIFTQPDNSCSFVVLIQPGAFKSKSGVLRRWENDSLSLSCIYTSFAVVEIIRQNVGTPLKASYQISGYFTLIDNGSVICKEKQHAITRESRQIRCENVVKNLAKNASLGIP